MASHRLPTLRTRRWILRRPRLASGPVAPVARLHSRDMEPLALTRQCGAGQSGARQSGAGQSGMAHPVSRRSLLAGFASLGGLILFPGAAFAVPTAKDVRLGKPTPDITRVVVDVSEEMRFSLFSLAGPDRIIVDLPEVDWQLSREGLFGGGGIIKAMRYGLFQGGNSRMVLDLASPAMVKQAFMLPPNEGGGWRLVIDLQPTTPELFAAASGPERRIGTFRPPASATDLVAEPTPASQTASSAGDRKTGSQKADPQKTPSSGKEDRASGKEDRASSKARGQRKTVIMLDPGHGGIDPGAIGVSGVYEKNITLAAAKEFREILTASGRYDVRLTRDSDTFVPLRDRMALARQQGAELFVSIHADAVARPNVKGLSIYTLSEKASDSEAAALADSENKADIIAGIDLSHESAEVTNILIELAQRETMNLSSRVAETMIEELRREVTLLPKSHRYAGFAVLKAPDVPSILMEMGYLSNAEEEKLLKTKTYRSKLGKALLRAIDRYFATVQKASRT